MSLVSAMRRSPLSLVLAPTERQQNMIYAERTKQYLLHRKVNENTKVLVDAVDEIAYHPSTWNHDGELIAAARVLPLCDRIKSDAESYVAWPEWFPERSNCADVSRLIVVRSEKNIKTMESIFRGMVICALKGDRRYITGYCTKSLMSFYKENLDAKFSKEGFSHTELNGLEHFLFYADMEEVLRLRSS